ncbi:hypothetical protein JCGZ_02417 [Jatropha curcas]|uniref:Aminotransferase-like plant mobile domain-containing protein n=1 Tax=Jatropha curcas TaxID=180498 RepID=A0A067LES3_JATCU|nr:hypothetical protein JCGZ_02417 [Jatropha curcas]
MGVPPAQRRVPHAPPRHMCMLEGMTAEDREEEYEGSVVGGFLSAGDYPAYFSTRMQARLPEVLEYTKERKTHKTAAHYRAEAVAEAEAAAAPIFLTQVDLGKARTGGSSTDASAFWDLLDLPMHARVVAASFGDYAAGLRRTQPHFRLAMRYALMERWNDCTHTFVFDFGEMTLTPVDYAAITGLRFAGPVAPLDARYQTTTLGAQLVRSLLGVTTQTRYTAQGCVSYEVVYQF